MWDWDKPRKRTLGATERKILYERAGRKCEACGKDLNFIDMIPGHRTAYSKSGRTTLRNSVCLCNTCNVEQGTDSYSVFLRKLGKSSPSNQAKDVLKSLTVAQLKELAKIHKVTVRGKKEEDWYGITPKAPTKAQYITAISKKVSPQELTQSIKDIPAPVK